MIMAKVFICYRRDDDPWFPSILYDALEEHFGQGQIILDVENIPAGEDFRAYLEKSVRDCKIFLVVIGDRWLEILKSRRKDLKDFVRLEIEVALKRQIPVVPVLIGKAKMPTGSALPPKLKDLAYKQGVEVRAGPDRKNHLNRLVLALDATLKAEEELKIERAARPESVLHQREDENPVSSSSRVRRVSTALTHFSKLLVARGSALLSRKPSFKVLLAALGLCVAVVFVPMLYYYVYYARIIDRILSGELFDNAVKIYVAPFRVYSGQKLSLEDIVVRLQRAGFNTPDKAASANGFYEVAAGQI